HSIPDWKSSVEISLINENQESIFTQFIHAVPEENEMEIESELEKEIDDKFTNLPPLGPNQMYIKILLESKLNPGSLFEPKNYGVIAVHFTEDNPQISIGREELANAYWYDTTSFTSEPFIFDYIPSTAQESSQFKLLQRDHSILIIPGDNSLNPVTHVSKDGILSKLIEPVSLESLQRIIFSSYYAYDKKTSENNSYFRFSLSFSWQKPEMKELT
ncbi:MAG: hypothetical protein KAR20_01145, partial [Candidatus Heimdallarchaeota archaeon]|nr:hypothetical protein [Candidatus Heimdallarchaeota archaeon]